MPVRRRRSDGGISSSKGGCRLVSGGFAWHAMKAFAAQAAFDVTAEQLACLNEQGVLRTGSYLSGKSMGQPRIPGSIKPNTGCLLTVKPDGAEEAARQILGVAMVREDFWGDACRDGLVRLHDRYRIMLPEPMPLWPFFAREEQQPSWGSIPYRIFSNQTMRTILRDMLVRLEHTPQVEEASALYRYFCDMNQMMQ